MPDARANYAVFQAHLSHENDNLNQRLFWFLFSQSLLFSAFSASLNGPGTARNPAVAEVQDLLVWVIPITAVLLACALYPMIIISLRHMTGLRRQFEPQLDEDCLGLPPIHGEPSLRRIGDWSYAAMPLILIGAWLVLLARLVA